MRYAAPMYFDKPITEVFRRHSPTLMGLRCPPPCYHPCRKSRQIHKSTAVVHPTVQHPPTSLFGTPEAMRDSTQLQACVSLKHCSSIRHPTLVSASILRPSADIQKSVIFAFEKMSLLPLAHTWSSFSSMYPWQDQRPVGRLFGYVAAGSPVPTLTARGESSVG